MSTLHAASSLILAVGWLRLPRLGVVTPLGLWHASRKPGRPALGPGQAGRRSLPPAPFQLWSRLRTSRFVGGESYGCHRGLSGAGERVAGHPTVALAVDGQMGAGDPALPRYAFSYGWGSWCSASWRGWRSWSLAAIRAESSSSTWACCGGSGGCSTTPSASSAPISTRRSRWPMTRPIRPGSRSSTPGGCPAGWPWSNGGCWLSRSTSSFAVFTGGGSWLGWQLENRGGSWGRSPG